MVTIVTLVLVRYGHDCYISVVTLYMVTIVTLVLLHYGHDCYISIVTLCLDTWILGVASKQLRLLHGRVGDSTIVVNYLSPQMSELVEDAIAP